MSGENTHRSEIDHLKKLIRQSGFPLQIEIASFLESARVSMNLEDLEVSTSAYYLDRDEKKGRELDLKVKIPIEYKGKFKGKPLDLIGIFLNLLIQCKSIPGNTWVFFKTSHEVFSVPKCTSVLDSLEWEDRLHARFAFLRDLHYRQVPKTTLYDEYILDENKTNKRVDNLFEAIISLVKATSYELNTLVQGLKSDVDRTDDILDNPLDFAELFYPIVVFDGKMYLAERTEKYGKMNLTPIDHVCLFFDYVSGSYNIDLYVDIVQREAFDKFFHSVLNDIEILRKALENEIGIKFRQEVMKALKWYVGKKHGTFG